MAFAKSTEHPTFYLNWARRCIFFSFKKKEKPNRGEGVSTDKNIVKKDCCHPQSLITNIPAMLNNFLWVKKREKHAKSPGRH